MVVLSFSSFARYVCCLAAFFSGLGVRVCVDASNYTEPQLFFGGSLHEDFLDWYNQRGSIYKNAAYLPSLDDPSLGLAVLWTLDDTHISLAVAAKATGWLGLGLSENGGMAGADLLLFEAANPKAVKDGYILDELQPLEDDCNNWEFVNSEVKDDSEFMIVEVRRLIDTGDPKDRVLIYDGDKALAGSRLIAAWGNTPQVSYHGTTDRVKAHIRWFDGAVDDEQAFAALMLEDADGFFEMRANDYAVLPVVTDYHDFCFTWDDILAQGVPNTTFSVIGFRPILQTPAMLHHFTLFGSKDTMAGKSCEEFANIYDLVYGWARGEPPGALPEDVGLYIGPGSFQSFRLLVHYDNPQMLNGTIDSSGIRFYYTNKMRPLELGIVQMGDPGVLLENQTLPDGLSEYSFYCPSSCTETVLKQNVTVLREYMHMHHTGQAMKLEQIRNGEVIHTGRVDFFRFDHQQGNQAVQEVQYTVQKGDAYRTTCNYNTTGMGETKFGWGSNDEMCMAFIMYYPKQSFLGIAPWFCDPDPTFGFSPCLATHENRTIDALSRVFGEETEVCNKADASGKGANDVFAPTSDGLKMVAIRAGSVLATLMAFAGWI